MVRAGAGVTALASARYLWHQQTYVSSMDSPMSQVGRPKKDTESINLRLERTMIEAIDDLRRQEPDIPTRPEMIRRILVKHLGMQDSDT